MKYSIPKYQKPYQSINKVNYLTLPPKKQGFNLNLGHNMYHRSNKDDLNSSIEKQKKFMLDWQSSPMYDEMLTNSTDNILDKAYISTNRDNNLENVNIKLKKNDVIGLGGTSNSFTGDINLYPAGYRGPQFENMVVHELSHSSDRPRNWANPNLRKFFGDNYASEGTRNIPTKDINLIQSYTKTQETKNPHINNNANIQSKNYYTKPTEVRARLNSLRFTGKESNIYNPFIEKITHKNIDALIRASKVSGEFDPYKQLNSIYSKEQIINMLNTTSENKVESENEVNYTKQGGKLIPRKINKLCLDK